MKLSEITVGTEYAIVPSWTYSSRESRQPSNVSERDVVKAVVVSLDKYEYDSDNRDSDPNVFRLAEQGSRSIGVLVRACEANQDGSHTHWTSRLADVVAEWNTLTPRWDKEKADKEQREREEEERKARAERKRNETISRVHSARNSIITTTKDLLGDSSQVTVDTSGYGEEVRAVVTMGLDEYERLIELAYEGLDERKVS